MPHDAPTHLDDCLALAHRLADASGAILRDRRRHLRESAQDFFTKDDASPVTEADREIETVLRAMIAREFPQHGILGEEFDATGTDAEYVWVIDPIDGTKPYIAGLPIYGTLICLAHHGRPVIGIIDHPITDERWQGVTGRPSMLNGRPIRTRSCARMADALLSCSNPEPFGPGGPLELLDRLRAETKWCLYGSSCYAYASLASGLIDLGIDTGRHREVDYCALVPVIEGAGGVITDWDGQPLTIHSGSQLVAAGDPERHAEVLAILREIAECRA